MALILSASSSDLHTRLSATVCDGFLLRWGTKWGTIIGKAGAGEPAPVLEGNSLNYYETLGVPRNATKAEIKAAFEKWTSVYNSETDPDPARAAQSAKLVAEAYRVLNDPERRKEYDQLLERLESPAENGAISAEEFRSWLGPGATIASGLAAKIEAERIRGQEQLAKASRKGQHMKAVFKTAVWIVSIALLFVLFSQVAPLVFPESPWAYALKYNTDDSRVQVVPRPADCDWGRAPLGNKGCHYEKEISVTGYSTDAKTGRPMVTYDDGKTWNWLAEGAKPGPVQVYVTWRKVQDGP